MHGEHLHHLTSEAFDQAVNPKEMIAPKWSTSLLGSHTLQKLEQVTVRGKDQGRVFAR